MKRLPVFHGQGFDRAIQEPTDDFGQALEEHVIRPLWVHDDVIRFKKFHAKFYAGIFSTHVEVMHTSYNLFEKEDGQLENVSMNIYHPQYFFRQFITPFGVDKLVSPPDSALEKQKKIGVLHLKKKGDSFEGERLEYTDRIWDLICQVEVATSGKAESK